MCILKWIILTRKCQYIVLYISINAHYIGFCLEFLKFKPWVSKISSTKGIMVTQIIERPGREHNRDSGCISAQIKSLWLVWIRSQFFVYLGQFLSMSVSPLILPLKNHIHLTSEVFFPTNRTSASAFLECSTGASDQSHHPQRAPCLCSPAGSH